MRHPADAAAHLDRPGGAVRVVLDGESITVALDDVTFAELRRAVALGKERHQRDLERVVARYLREHPDASANAIYRTFGGRRADVLAAVKTVRVASESDPSVASPVSPVPAPEYQPSEGTGS